jgi:hypothetical protein
MAAVVTLSGERLMTVAFGASAAVDVASLPHDIVVRLRPAMASALVIPSPIR